MIHTSVRHRLDVLTVWVRAMRAFGPAVPLHVWYSSDRPTVGDVLHEMPHAGLGSARWVLHRLPPDQQRVFVECDVIPVRPWSPQDYPGPLVMLEGSPGRRWCGVTIAEPRASLSQPVTLLRQRRIVDGGCPDWLPDELCGPAMAADAKVVGEHFLHLDKMHRPQGASQAKTDLLAAVSAWLPAPRPGLGDIVAAGLSAVGITKERVQAVTGKPCGCAKRQQRLNELGRKLGFG